MVLEKSKSRCNYSGFQVHSSGSAPLLAAKAASFLTKVTLSCEFKYEGCFACGRVAFFILLEIVDEPMNGRSCSKCAAPRYLRTVQFSSVNLEP